VCSSDLTNESKATMFASPTFTGTVTDAGIIRRSITGGTATTSAVTIDSFSTTTYRSAQYVLQASRITGDYQVSTVTFVHDGTTVSQVDTNIAYTGTLPFMTYDATITGSTLTVTAQTAAGTAVIVGSATLIGV